MQTEPNVNNLSGPKIFELQSSREYLVQYFDWMKSRNSSMSLRSWARMMGLRDHSLLVLLLKGKRSVRHQHIDFLLRGLTVSEAEKRRFKLLVQADNAQDEEERLMLLNNSSAHDNFEMKLEEFRLISHWVHFALLEMTELKGFRFDPDWIAAHLDPPVTKSEISSAWERLVRLGLVKEHRGKWKKTNRALTTSGKSSSQAVRAHHHQIIDLAKRAVDTQAIEERVLNSCTMTIDRKKLPVAQELILEFRKKMESLLEVSGGDSTYQLSVQFFRLSRDHEKKKNIKEGK
jgi:uncharacterized protein (TIGR02147 family)